MGSIAMEGVQGPNEDAIRAEQTGCNVAQQKVELNFDFSQNISGRTEIHIHPESKNFKFIELHARQCHLSKVTINGVKAASIRHHDPCDQMSLHFNSTVHQHHLLNDKIESSRQEFPEPDLVIEVPKAVQIKEVDVAEVHTLDGGTVEVAASDGPNKDAVQTQGLSDVSSAKFTPLVVIIEFSTIHLREAVQFVTGQRGGGRWPHAYTRSKLGGSAASALFPCVDFASERCIWDLSITCPRTVGDALAQCSSVADSGHTRNGSRPSHEKREMLVIASGDITEDAVVKTDPTKKTFSFTGLQQLSARQIGFAIGPFERIDLSDFRETDDLEKLGSNAVQMLGYCLPGRKEETRNTCMPTPRAMDTFIQRYTPCPSTRFSMCFVEDLGHDTSVFADLTICSTRMLYPEDVIDPAQEVTRSLVHGIAYQWVGINVVPEAAVDTWTTVGIAYFMTDLFMRDLCGNNEYRYMIRNQADRVFELDRERPSIYRLGALLSIHPSQYDFIALKASVVLFILDRRMQKSAGTSKMPGIISKILMRARTGDLPNNSISTDYLQKLVEKTHHAPIADFMEQWVKGAGCPQFRAIQKFNKKKLVIEMTISQIQNTIVDRGLDADTFLRDAREDWGFVWAEEPQAVFTGPMTIRIHEADGTPYEHIVQIREAKTTFEVPYNTKYKRLKRSKLQRSKPSARQAGEGGDEESDSLVYCLGDTLQSEEEIKEWRITEWSPEDEQRMNAESYEWLRLDADFEWIARIELNMPGYMYTSQLQQDRDVVAQLEAVKNISNYHAQPLVSGILVRTLMDRRYFHGVRHFAALGLARQATAEIDWVGLFHLKKAFETLFCSADHGLSMTRPNDFSDQQLYRLQCAIIESMSKIRDAQGHTPKEIKEFLLDKLKFNDNSNNAYSDAFYIQKVMKALTNAVMARQTGEVHDDDLDLALAEVLHTNNKIEKECLDEIDRFRRMDEWTSSYQNLYSRTALEVQSTLAYANIGKFSPLHFLQYTRPGNYDLLRLSAYNILIQPNIIELPSVLKYILHCMVADSSLLIREHLQSAFGKVLAKRAIGTTRPDQAPSSEGLIIESISDDARAQEVNRRHNIPAAIEALKKELGEDEVLKKGLWDAVNYSEITLDDLAILLDFCRMLYTPKDEMKMKLAYPRYWRVRNLGKVSRHSLFIPLDVHQLGTNSSSGQAQVQSYEQDPNKDPVQVAAAETGHAIATASAAHQAQVEAAAVLAASTAAFEGTIDFFWEGNACTSGYASTTISAASSTAGAQDYA